MTEIFSRRHWLQAAGAAALLAGSSYAFAKRVDEVSTRLEAIRSRLGGRLGVHVLDTHTGRRVRFDDDSRYATASTFKLLLAAAVLKRVDRAEVSLAEPLAYSEKDMKTNSPVTEQHVAAGSLSLQELCAAIIQVSDNTAANLLINLIGGPPAITAFARELGDDVTHMDRMEVELNSNLPGDSRDTTSPKAMVGCMQRLFVGGALSAASVELLTTWMINAKTGLGRIRGGIPKLWRAGDKTGTGANGAVNDVAVLWPPGRKPIFIAIYMSESRLSTDTLAAAQAEIAAMLFDEKRIVNT